MAERLVPLRLLTAQDLDSGASVETGVIDCRNGSLDHLLIKIVQGSGNADVRIQVALSEDGTNFNSYDSQDDVITSTATEFAGKNPEELHPFLCTENAPFLRFKITDAATLDNNSVTLVGYLREI